MAKEAVRPRDAMVTGQDGRPWPWRRRECGVYHRESPQGVQTGRSPVRTQGRRLGGRDQRAPSDEGGSGLDFPVDEFYMFIFI